MADTVKLNTAAKNFDGSILQLPSNEVSTSDLADAIRYLALGLKDLAEALKRS